MMANFDGIKTTLNVSSSSLVSGSDERRERSKDLTFSGRTTALSAGIVQASQSPKDPLKSVLSEGAKLRAISIAQRAEEGQGDAGAQAYSLLGAVGMTSYLAKSKGIPYDAHGEDIVVALSASKGQRLKALSEMHQQDPSVGQVVRQIGANIFSQSDEVDEADKLYETTHRMKRFYKNYQAFSQQRRIRATTRISNKTKAVSTTNKVANAKTDILTIKKVRATAKGGGSFVSAIAAGGMTLPVMVVFFFIITAVIIFGGFAGANASNSTKGVEGLPPYITADMVEAALEAQATYGHPAGCTIAQIIVESGLGDHMSGLATRDFNLFGMKWAGSFADCPEVAGYSNWQTGEEYGGEQITIMDSFTRFKSHRDCIIFRSRVFLQSSRYSSNPAIMQAIANHDSDKMAEGLKSAGWATSSAYVTSLKSVMDQYDLRRFDTMTVEDFRRSSTSVSGTVSDGSLSSRQKAIINAAYNTPSPGPGLCAMYVSQVWTKAGFSCPYGNACDMYYAWCHSSNLEDLKPGMIIAVPTHNSTADARRYGHVCIYIGNNTVRENVLGQVRDTPLSSWLSCYGGAATPKWGWIFGLNLSS